MGSCATKNQDNEVSIPQNPRLMRYYQQYLQIIQITHPLNVNQKYNSFFTLIPDQFIGEGIRRTNQYISRLAQDEWNQKRIEFWDSRIEGAKENWHTIKSAIDVDEISGTAKIMLQAADLRLVNGSMQILYDSTGQKYDLPVFILNRPVSFPEQNSCEQGIITNFPKQDIEIRVRSVKWTKDKEVKCSNHDKVSVLRNLLMSEVGATKARLFYNGKELQPHHLIGNYGVQNQMIIQVFF